MSGQANRGPVVWAIFCYREGDNSQILAVAEGLGWHVEIKRLAYRRLGYAIDVWRGTTLLGLDRSKSDPLEPPWPDLVISASMRNEPVCRWIRRQSGGRTRYVHMGRTWAPIETFDLVVTAPEFRLPDLPNIHHNALSLHRVRPGTLAEAAATWTPRLAHLPRPRIAVLVGGYGGPYAFDVAQARRLGREASALAAGQGGSLLITTSARTRPSATDALEHAVGVPRHVFRWAARSPDNPFYAYLALADAFIVTCDSASMLAEACATGKPVYMFDLGPGARGGGGGRHAREEGPGLLRPRRWACGWDRLKAFVYRQMLKVPPRRMTRDIRLVHAFLTGSGRAVWLGQSSPDVMPPPLDEMRPTIERIRALFADRDRQPEAASVVARFEAPAEQRIADLPEPVDRLGA